MAAPHTSPLIHDEVTQPREDGVSLQVSTNNDDLASSSDLADDTNGDSDDDLDNEIMPQDVDGDVDSLIGVSMSRAQTALKSPMTPAAIKARALDASRSYFAVEPESIEDSHDEELVQATEEVSPPSPHTQPARMIGEVAPSPVRETHPQWVGAENKPEKRSSLVSSILGTATSTRPRSSSGSSMVGSIRKRLPAMPSVSLPKFTGSSDSGKRTLGPAGSGKVTSPTSLRDRKSTTSSQGMEQWQHTNATSRSRAHITGLDGNIESSQAGMGTYSAPRPPTLRRATSDQSLYLRRAPTGASDFDDYNAFANVSEMVNSRFKAITDTFQDSAFHMPKFPSLVYGQSKINKQTNIDETSSNTKTNRGSMMPSDMLRSKQPKANGTAVTSKHPILKEALLRMHGDLVIMGGYRGSVLREAQAPNRQLWVPIKVGVGLRKADLEVGLTLEDELRMEEKIIPDGALSHIGPVDICRRLIRKCKHCPNSQTDDLRVHNYGYDWRLSPDLLSDKFINFLEALPCNSKSLPAEERGAWIIAHSLGGLLTRHAINRRPDLFAGVVYAGTPQNCVNVLGPLRNGDNVLFSSSVLTAQVNFTLRTSFALLPQNGRCFINRKTGERYDVDFFDAEMWDEYRLSPCIKSPLHRDKPAKPEKEEKKATIMGSIADVLAAPTKRSSWFGSTNDDVNAVRASSPSPARHVKENAQEAGDKVEEAAEDAKPEGPLSPTMGNGQGKHQPAISTLSTIPVPVAKEYLARTLKSVLEFKKSLTYIPELQTRNAYPPASILYAKNTPTVYGAFVSSREAAKYDDAFDDLAFAAGDGVVLASAAQLPVGYRCVRNGRIESERGHVGLLGDLEGVGKCLHAIVDARERGVGRGAYEQVQVRGSS